MCLDQGHNALPLARLKLATPRSRDKHSTTEPPRSHFNHLPEVICLKSQILFANFNLGGALMVKSESLEADIFT